MPEGGGTAPAVPVAVRGRLPGRPQDERPGAEVLDLGGQAGHLVLETGDTLPGPGHRGPPGVSTTVAVVKAANLTFPE